MNKISIKLIILYFIFTANLVSNPKVDVKTAILIDHDSNKIIYELEPDMSIYPASMTKIMTAIVAFDLIKSWLQFNIAVSSIVKFLKIFVFILKFYII